MSELSEYGYDQGDAEEFQSGAFELDSEQIGSIRTEWQASTPIEQSSVKSRVLRLHDKFLESFAPYLLGAFSNEEIASKFIVVDSEAYPEFVENWIDTSGCQVASYAASHGDARAFIDEGNFVVLYPYPLWRYIPDEHWNAMLESSGMSKEELAAVITEGHQGNQILHEMTHLYQATSGLAPFLLIETQAYWIARELPENSFGSAASNAIADFYAYLLEKYGDEVHALCFGSSGNQELANNLAAEFTPEVVSLLFPDYRIEQH